MKAKVLIADDDPLMRMLVVVSLGDLAEVTEASGGNVAMALFDNREFDVVILDWDMPGMNGLDVLKAIRAQGSCVPIIMATAEAHKGQILKAIHAGASDYLVKPFEGCTLREKLEKLCPACCKS